METLKRLFLFYAILSCSTVDYTSQECGLCVRVGHLTDCSALGWRYVRNIPFWCSSSTRVLLLNNNLITHVPRFPHYAWRTLSRVYMLNNPLDCQRECSIGIPEYVTTSCHCSAGSASIKVPQSTTSQDGDAGNGPSNVNAIETASSDTLSLPNNDQSGQLNHNIIYVLTYSSVDSKFRK